VRREGEMGEGRSGGGAYDEMRREKADGCVYVYVHEIRPTENYR
jgi:hypothetical protein